MKRKGGIGYSILGAILIILLLVFLVLIALGIIVVGAAALVVIVPLIIIMAIVSWIKGKHRKEPKELEDPLQYEEWEHRGW
ncbi:hypothetical protein A3L11_08215 [Thermococcus siculi]|uniref:Uncharacterized protein n=1 Tax=Thermococcus siculi TaxID=72803 RepID=A0A2Z2MYI5_9EURY|nr:hypothetical protein [Thermococcus siculi]ASJ09213.1 hypothetical protein A3L11_08215 [Thermococcus siculi]